MLAKLRNILTYYDSEPTEITQAVIWFLFFPVIYTLEHGLNLFLVIVSVVIGFCTLRAVCSANLRVRKTLAYATFLFSVVAVVVFFSHGDWRCPTHWGWVLISLSAFFSLKRITNHFYIKNSRHD